MSYAALQVIAAVLSIVLLTTLVLKAKLHPFLAVLCATVFLALAIHMNAVLAVTSFTAGVGATLGQVAIVLALGAVLGEMLSVSGGAETLAVTLISNTGARGLPWAMLLLGFVVGMPVFFEVGLVLLVPIALTVAKRSGKSPIAIALPTLAGLSITHGLIPPHPAALLAMGIFHADIAKGILFGLIIGLPSAVLAGPLFLWLIRRSDAVLHPAIAATSADVSDSSPFTDPDATAPNASRPGLVTSASITLLPVVLILLGNLSDRVWPTRLPHVHTVLHTIGIPVVALLIAVLWSFYVVHRTRGLNMHSIERFAERSLGPMASFVFILGAAGGYCRILQDSGIAATIVAAALRGHLPLILLAWLIAVGVRVATGSATISMTTSATIVATAMVGTPLPHPELLALAAGAGSLFFSHVNDGGFWMVKGFLNLSLKETFATWSIMETILSVSGLIFALALSAVLR